MTTRSSPEIRPARLGDVPQLLELMRGLAAFEGYSDRFTVTEADLIERGFSPQHEPQFHALVASADGQLLGYALTYIIPFTFDLRPTLVLKEFYVTAGARGGGIGRSLYTAVMDHGRDRGVRLLRWQVLPSNEAAMRFYRSFGGEIDRDWDNWVLEIQSE